jgi:hypothetical protein
MAPLGLYLAQSKVSRMVETAIANPFHSIGSFPGKIKKALYFSMVRQGGQTAITG